MLNLRANAWDCVLLRGIADGVQERHQGAIERCRDPETQREWDYTTPLRGL